MLQWIANWLWSGRSLFLYTYLYTKRHKNRLSLFSFCVIAVLVTFKKVKSSKLICIHCIKDKDKLRQFVVFSKQLRFIIQTVKQLQKIEMNSAKHHLVVHFFQPCSYWSQWSSYGACTVSCGNGTQIRQRLCIDGFDCIGDTLDAQPCNTEVIVLFKFTSASEVGSIPMSIIPNQKIKISFHSSPSCQLRLLCLVLRGCLHASIFKYSVAVWPGFAVSRPYWNWTVLNGIVSVAAWFL